MGLLKSGDPVLVLCAHPDDEIACAGYISRLVEEGHPIHYVYFSSCANSTAALGHDPARLIDECKASCAVLGISPEHMSAFDIPTRHFPEHRQTILEALVKLRREIEPGLVFVASSSDIHQDHATLSQEGLRAFKHTNVLGYEFPWNVTVSKVDLLVRLEERHVMKKRAAWECYKTQQSRNYYGPELVDSLARVRGVQANAQFAEAYEVLRLVI